MKIGLMGGTFNPIHNGHIKMMEKAAELEDLEYIMLIPTGDPPHKVKSEVISKYHRYEMCLLCAAHMDNVVVSSVEIERNGTTYTIDTLRELENRYGRFEDLHFIIGADTVMGLRKWKEFGEVCKRCRFIAFGREELKDQEVQDEIARLKEEFGAHIRLLKESIPDVSSSELRDRIKEGMSVKGMIPGSVEVYIKKNMLYTGEKI